MPGAEHRLPVEAPNPAPPPWIAALSARVQRHLAGHPPDFSDPPSDFTRVPEFHRAVLRATLPVKSGHTTTYGAIAATLGPPPGASPAAGTALGANPRPLVIPCHHVVAASDKMTGFSGPGGVAPQARLLAREAAQLLSATHRLAGDSELRPTPFVKKTHRAATPALSPALLRRLEKNARAAADASYSPYSEFPVGAAIVCGSGKVFTGCNVENASYGLCNCAERTAIFSAAATGERVVHAVVVYTPTPTPSSPCGACRQVINEFGPDALVISVCDGPGRIETPLSALLPDAFGPRNLL